MARIDQDATDFAKCDDCGEETGIADIERCDECGHDLCHDCEIEHIEDGCSDED